MSGQEKSKDPVGRALGSLDHLIDVFHDKILRPIMLAGRTIAFGFILMLVGVMVTAMLLILSFRLLDVYAFPGAQWATYLVIGGLLIVAGCVIWRQRRPLRLRK